MAAEDRRALDLEKALERELQSVAQEQAREQGRSDETFPPEYYAQFNSPDTHGLPQAQDLDAVAEAQAAAKAQPGYQDAQYGPAPEPMLDPAPASNVYQPPQFAADPPVASTPAADPASPSEAAPAVAEAVAAAPAEPPARGFSPQPEPSIDLHYAPPAPSERAEDPRAAEDSRETDAPPVAVNENRVPEATQLLVRTGAGAFSWIVAAIALAALAVALWQTFVFQRGIAAMESNIARGQFVLACRDSIGSYYDARQKLSVLMPAADRSNIVGASRVTEYNRIEAKTAIAKVSALAGYLATFQDAGARVRYSELTRALNGIMDVARTTPLSDIDRVFAPADKLFSEINDDCVRLSQNARL